jgi:hypothetical protein
MIALLLAIFTAHGHTGITVIESSDRQLAAQVSFTEINKREQVPVTRFIIAEQQPSFSYRVTAIDSAVHKSTPEIRNPSPIKTGEPLRMGNTKLYPITVYPTYIDANNQIHIESIEITIDIVRSSNTLELPYSLAQVFDKLVLNYTSMEDIEPSGYLIIAPDAFIDELTPLANWKERKGWHVEVRSLSQTGSTPTEIKNFIASAYNTWTPAPEYVLLAGTVNYIPAASSYPSTTDHPYTMVDGNDFFSEVLIGRLPANSELELNTMVAKIIGYETDPYMINTTWFERSLMVGANVPPEIMTSPLPTKRWVRNRLLEYGFNTVDTVFHPMPGSAISTAVNQGTIFVNYRSGEGDIGGWPWPLFTNSEVNALSNGWMLPIVTSITCWTGNFASSVCFGTTWLRAGNPVNPKGAVGFFGSSSPSTHSRWNNCLDHGVYWAFANENITDLGPALYRGKMEVYTNFPGDTSISSGSSFYFHSFNLLGDPSLSVWTDIPDTFLATHSSSMPVGANFFSITVTNSSSQPVEDAMVSLYKDGEVKEIAFTDASGYVDFNFGTSTQDTLFVTVTKQNHKPYQGFCLINNSAVYVDYFSHTISDPGGNNNGEVNPGETIQLGVTLKNYGNATTATNVSARLSTNDPLVTITDSIKSYGSINPGATASAAPFVFNVSTSAKNSHVLRFNLNVTSNQGNWTGSVWIEVEAPEFGYQRYTVLDGGNGYLEPGETSDFIISMQNIGQLTGNSINGILQSINPGVAVTDSIGSFGNIATGDSATNNGNRFVLSAVNSISPGYPLEFMAILNGANDFRDTVEFELMLGVSTARPLGPDDYGYFAYDDTDIGYSEKPDYSWVEVDPNHGGPGDSLVMVNDTTITMALPFSFKYYGNWYNQVSISSNGYIAMGTTSLADIYNWAIPAAGGPPLLIAPFWDDLDPTFTDSSGNVSYWHDATNHRFVIEYSRMQHVHDPTNPTPGELQTFDVILYDPQYYVTQTGDGEILFQYMDITNDDVWHNYATVGIEDYGHTTGLEYTFANSYPDAAAPLANNRAIKFTTDPPDTFYGIKEFKNSVATSCWLEISPSPFRQIANIRYMIHDPGYTIPNPKLAIYDVSGRVIKSFNLESSIMYHESTVLWDGTDNIGKRVPKGVYFVRLQGTYLTVTEKVILVE